MSFKNGDKVRIKSHRSHDNEGTIQIRTDRHVLYYRKNRTGQAGEDSAGTLYPVAYSGLGWDYIDADDLVLIVPEKNYEIHEQQVVLNVEPNSTHSVDLPKSFVGMINVFSNIGGLAQFAAFAGDLDPAMRKGSLPRLYWKNTKFEIDARGWETLNNLGRTIAMYVDVRGMVETKMLFKCGDKVVWTGKPDRVMTVVDARVQKGVSAFVSDAKSKTNFYACSWGDEGHNQHYDFSALTIWQLGIQHIDSSSGLEVFSENVLSLYVEPVKADHCVTTGTNTIGAGYVFNTTYYDKHGNIISQAKLPIKEGDIVRLKVGGYDRPKMVVGRITRKPGFPDSALCRYYCDNSSKHVELWAELATLEAVEEKK